MSDGTISIKLAPNYAMPAVQHQVDSLNAEDIIRNDGFFPDLSLADFRHQARVDGTVTTARLQDAVIEAMASVNQELASLKTQYGDQPFYAIGSPQINGESLMVYRYRRAVTCLALANLYERYTSYDTTNDGEKKAELLNESIDELRRDARFAISDMLKVRRINVELI
ncbi:MULTISPECIES: head completion/stabilization protein [Pasteurellaceae]|uniref:Head completion/stabilization protein n=2 Tax=Pasteurellaceae TaxID=712 RepID=A0AAE5TKK5_AVIPA|nr:MULTISPECIES: head completion/stabilization protein [Pasteurellaceae]KGQ36698.1 phage head protein [Gallibacterium genomosp. 1]MEE3609028.1 head completion/stabilization protein [Avibacterium paragallinarum]MEE3621297.1 head completion/stabilization protein [Avibacterium paragallinarum]MEE3668545.1 head completion/stabilization protein [Avibacterium paragallinarum]MEE3681234.1 head completion/stabilization protein [Avibacterium paragallinarum]